MPHVQLPKVGTDRAWREAARACLRARLAPEAVTWSRGGGAATLFDEGSAPPPARAGAAIKVPASFVDLAGLVAWHSDPERFARLYALLWRLRLEPALMAEDRADPSVAKLRALEKGVRRDIHKTHAFVRFREAGEPGAPRRRFAAWFEPSHYTLEPSAPFFARRFADMDWMILTPDLSARFEDGVMTLADGESRPALPPDAAEEMWTTYFKNIFNPARVKVGAMLSEMPKKYWRNLPEAAAIPGMLQAAEGRMRAMAEALPTDAPLFAHRIAARAAPPPAPPEGEAATLGDLAAHEEACRRCPLHEHATQVVPGEGPPTAPLMMVGEQPGDTEDLKGRPFVGPAGQLLDESLRRAGIDRSAVFLTNAVKHFKFTLKGRRRLHQSPGTSEIAACRWWSEREIALVRPRLLVALGATAAESLTGSRKDVLRRRGAIEEGRDGLPVFLTVHPSFLLRLSDRAEQEEETGRFVADLLAARAHLDGLLAGGPPPVP